MIWTGPSGTRLQCLPAFSSAARTMEILLRKVCNPREPTPLRQRARKCKKQEQHGHRGLYEESRQGKEEVLTDHHDIALEKSCNF